MTIDTSQNVGIGTASPDAFLHVKTGTAQNDAHGLFKIEQTSTAATTAATNSGLTIKNHHGTAQFMQWENEGVRIGSRILTNSGIGDLVFTAGADSEKMRIEAGGNVGIGTTAPVNKLQVNGTGRINSLMVGDSSAANTPAVALHVKSSATNARIRIEDSDSSNDYWDFYVNQGDGLHFQEDGANRVTFKTGGNVGIGTTSPAAKLQVEALGIDTTTTSTTATTQVAIDSMVAATFRSARYTIQVTNSTDNTYHLTEMLLIHNGTTPSISEFGTIFTGSAAEAAFTADISSGNVRILATPASTDAMAFKVIRHSITV